MTQPPPTAVKQCNGMYISRKNILCNQKCVATSLMTASFCLMTSGGSMPSPQSGARISRSGEMCFKASVTRPSTCVI